MMSIITQIWPQWNPVEQLGKGSYGTVYKAIREDTRIQATAAIKVIAVPQDKSEHEALLSEGMTRQETKTYFKGIVDDFVEEIALMETFKGMQNIVSIEDYQVVENPETDGWLILVRMELLTPFVSYLVNHSMTEEEVIRFGIDLCTALEFCNTQNIIHRDIKPENIFVNKFGSFKLGDFGIAKCFESMTASHSQKGTFNYMAPEVANGTHYDARVDIYSLGIVLYRLLNQNNLPFINAENRMSPVGRKLALEKRLAGEPLSAPCEASDPMAKVILKACAYRPEDRFKDATEFKTALEAVKAGTLASIWVDETTSESPDKEDAFDKTVSIKTAKATDPDATTALHGRKEKPFDPDATTALRDRRKTRSAETPASSEAEKPIKKKLPKALLLIPAILVVIGVGLLLYNIISRNNRNETESVSEGSETEFNSSASEAEPATNMPASQSETAQTTASEAESTTEAPKAVDYNNIQVGDIIPFGYYEQDGDFTNGMEPIEWLVLAREGDKALVLSRDGIDTLIYSEISDNTTWENSALRTWLNGNFLLSAFSPKESALIQTTVVSADKYQGHEKVDQGKDTTDFIFLLSSSEVSAYFDSDESRKCTSSAYLQNYGVKATCDWWLRTHGFGTYSVLAVTKVGNIGEFSPTSSVPLVRPAMWIDLRGLPVEQEEDRKQAGQSSPSVGETITFGHYEQDNDLSNGKEPIEWHVIKKSTTSFFVISKYVLDYQEYDTGGSVSWSGSSLQKWLNQSFLNSAFSDEEKELLRDFDQMGRVFLPDQTDMTHNSFLTIFNRKGEVTPYASALGADKYSVAKGLASWWILRGAGIYVYFIDPGSGDCKSTPNPNVKRGVRPAMWIDIEKWNAAH